MGENTKGTPHKQSLCIVNPNIVLFGCIIHITYIRNRYYERLDCPPSWLYLLCSHSCIIMESSIKHITPSRRGRAPQERRCYLTK